MIWLMQSWLWQYLIEGDLAGFIIAIYTSLIGQVFWVFTVFLVSVPVYMRTKSLTTVCIIWILLGGVFVTVMPMASGMALLLTVLGIAGILYKVVFSES